jgi:hypothetical protein
VLGVIGLFFVQVMYRMAFMNILVPLWADLDQRDERPVVRRQTIGSAFTILGKHRTHLQDSGAERSGENKKDQRKNLNHHKKVMRKPPLNSPQFHRNAHHVEGVI